MAGMIPYLFLDVDGVLNPLFGWEAWDGFEDFEPHELTPDIALNQYKRSFRVHLSPLMGKALTALPVEIRWLTTWEQAADDLIAPILGLPRGLVISAQAPGLGNPPWKSRAVKETISIEPRPFIWVDDDAIPRDFSLDVPHLLIRPESHLTPDHLAEMREFAVANQC